MKREMDLAARADARSPMRDSALSPVRDMRTYSTESSPEGPEGAVVERSKEDEMCDAWNGERSQLRFISIILIYLSILTLTICQISVSALLSLQIALSQ